MSPNHFFTTIIEHYNNKLPFVVYRKPNTNAVKGLLQNDDKLYIIEQFTESGFVFAPFNSENDSILIPLEHSEAIETKYVSGALDNNASEAEKENENTSETTKESHINLVAKAVKTIHEEDDFKKVVISRKEAIKTAEENPVNLLKKLLDSYKTAFVYCWYHPSIGLWLGATPETLLKVKGSQLSTMALAGTQQYKDTTAVIWQDKERTEQQLVTDFIVNHVKPLVSSLSIGTTETLKAGNLLHLKTELRGLLEKGNNLKNIILALHPTPAVCGMPKARAKQFILDNENYNREFYTGFLGELNIKEHITRNNNRRNVENNAYNTLKTVTNLFVNLRCMQYKNNDIIIYVGGGITKDSIPEKEWEETVNKTLTVKSIL